jgi:hypothetical protein
MGEFEQLVLLALLRLGNDAYGMQVREEIETRTGREVSYGAVYTTLDRLEQKGYVAHRLGEATAERGGTREEILPGASGRAGGAADDAAGAGGHAAGREAVARCARGHEGTPAVQELRQAWQRLNGDAFQFGDRRPEMAFGADRVERGERGLRPLRRRRRHVGRHDILRGAVGKVDVQDFVEHLVLSQSMSPALAGTRSALKIASAPG